MNHQPRRRRASLAARVGLPLAAALCVALPARSTSRTPPRQLNAGGVLVTVTVTDERGAPVSGLTRGAFNVTVGKAAQEVTSFAGADGPSSVALILDTSESAGGKRQQAAAEAVARLVEAHGAAAEYFLMNFDDDVFVPLDWSRDPAAVAAALRQLSRARPGRQSALFDACYQAARKLSGGAHAKRVIILLSDGDDTYSRARQDDVVAALKKSNVVLYAVNVGAAPGEGVVARKAEKVLNKLAEESGGLSFRPRDSKALGEGVERIAAELRGQYVVGFRPPAGAAECQPFKVQLTQAEGAPDVKSLAARSRAEFCPPSS